MATVYSSEVSIGSYNRIRIKCDYSGTTANLTIQFRRTSSYTTTWADTAARLIFNGQDKDANYNYTGTVGTSWVNLRPTITGYTISTSGGTYNWQFTQPAGGVLGCSGTITVPAQSSTPPSGASATWKSHTWNSVTMTAKLTSWGSGYTTSSNVLQGIVCKSTATNNNWGGRICKEVLKASTTLTADGTVSNSNTFNVDGGMTLKGCTAYKIAGWAATNIGDTGTATGLNSTTYYTPPAPLASITKSESASSTANSVTHTITITGAGSTNNNSVTVTTQYRYSTDGGSNYSAWTSAGTGTPWTAKTATFTSTYGASIKVQARQQYQSQNSEFKELSYTATAGTAPATPTVSSFSCTNNSATGTVATTSWGTPSSISNRYVELEVATAGGSSTYRYAKVADATMSGTVTVNNSSSIYPSGSTLTLTGNTKYAYRGAAFNRVKSSSSSWVDFITKPNTPSACSLTVTGTTTATLSITSPTQGSAATMTAYYKLNSGSWTSAGTITSGSTITKSLTGLTAGTAYTATAKITNSTGDSGTITSSSATTYKAPNTPTVTNFVPLVNGGKATVSTSSYGVPASTSGRYIQLRIAQAGGGTTYRYFQVGNTTSQNNITVTSSSAIQPSGGSLTFAANTKYAYCGYANNTVLGATGSWVDFITLPAAPTATSSAINPVSGSLTITAPSQGTAATLTAYYKVGSGNYISAGTITPGASKTVTVTGLNPSTAYTITVKLTNSSGDSATTTTTFTTLKPLYCSVSGKAKIVRNLYCSVNGKTKKIVKLYGSVNGKTKRIW